MIPSLQELVAHEEAARDDFVRAVRYQCTLARAGGMGTDTYQRASGNTKRASEKYEHAATAVEYLATEGA